MMTVAGVEQIVRASELRDFAGAALQAVGMPDADATVTADAMVWADVRGLDAHGVTTKLPQCIARIREGGSAADPSFETISETPALLSIDAHHAWGQVAAARGMAAAIDRARVAGVGAVLVRNTGSAAAMGYYPMLAVAQRMIGLAFTNGPALMAPWGGTTRVLGNQAHAMGCPAGRHQPILFDSATTSMSTGEMDQLHERGETLPEGVLLDATGAPTRDPGVWRTGTLLPAGGHRGYGLSLMFEIMTGVLAGGAVAAPDVGHPFIYGEPQGVSLHLMAIDPSSMMPYDAFLERVDRLIDAIHASPPAAGFDRIYAPGERSAGLAAQRERDGVPLSAARWAILPDLADDLGVRWNPS
jgi:LDH2 family malate/lactate/ureidoglycolate dehydrogenase